MGDNLTELQKPELLARAQSGDQIALAELLCRLRAQILPGLHRTLKNRDDADDLVQEALLNIFASLSSFRGDARALTWAWTVARNAALNWIRDETNRRGLLDAHVAAAPAVPGMGEPAQDPERAALLQEQLIAVQKACDKLPERDRTLIRESAMRYLEGYDRDDASSPPMDSTLRMALSRARGRLRALLERGEDKS